MKIILGFAIMALGGYLCTLAMGDTSSPISVLGLTEFFAGIIVFFTGLGIAVDDFVNRLPI
ncbi:MAG: hypothetical protein Q7S53_05720 [bacterium]|nr:hypothetical protein [bacterium]